MQMEGREKVRLYDGRGAGFQGDEEDEDVEREVERLEVVSAQSGGDDLNLLDAVRRRGMDVAAVAAPSVVQSTRCRHIWIEHAEQGVLLLFKQLFICSFTFECRAEAPGVARAFVDEMLGGLGPCASEGVVVGLWGVVIGLRLEWVGLGRGVWRGASVGDLEPRAGAGSGRSLSHDGPSTVRGGAP